MYIKSSKNFIRFIANVKGHEKYETTKLDKDTDEKM